MSTGPDTSEFNASLPKKPKYLFQLTKRAIKEKTRIKEKRPLASIW